MNINYPNITDLSDKGKNEIKNYLFSLVNQLNYSFAETEKNTKYGEGKIEMIEKKYDNIDNSLKTIISLIKSLKNNGGETDNESYDKGFTDGKQAEYDRFWDSFQQNGTKTRYHYAFCGEGWTQETLKPKYLIKPGAEYRGIRQMFMKCNWNNNSFIDFSLIKDKFDFSQCIDAESTFSNCYIDNIDVDFSNCTSLSQTFNHSDNGKTPNIRLKVSEKTVFQNTFSYGVHTKVTFTEDSVIGQNGLSLKRQTQMEKSHITSVINALSTTTNGLSVELSLQAVNKAFETSEGANDGSKSTEWQTLVNTKKNWTIKLS